MAKEVFDYSKYSSKDYTYYGFHLKDGRYHIDTKRLKKIHCDGSFPKALFISSRNTHYFVPKHKYEKEWAVTILRTQLNKLANDWNTEFKTVINKISTPKEVKDRARLDGLASRSNSDDMDDVEFDALMAGIRRESKYYEVIKSIHLQYTQKIFTEFFRALLIVLMDRGYENKEDFKYENLLYYVQNRFGIENKKANPIYQLEHYRYFDLLNKIDNFLKHNTRRAYNALANNAFEKDEKIKEFQASFVYSTKETGFEYESGMYAGYWLKIDGNFVNDILLNLQKFSEEFCKLVYGEDVEESFWNSDESLVRILKDNYIDFM